MYVYWIMYAFACEVFTFTRLELVKVLVRFELATSAQAHGPNSLYILVYTRCPAILKVLRMFRAKEGI